jgi:phage/plasmid-like protein (TIGR03299 family)
MSTPAFAVSNDLNWTVSHRPLFFTGNDGQPAKWDEKVAVVRDDNGKCLGSVSPTYETVQNKDLLSLIQPMVDEEVLKIENVGYLSYGAKVFAQAKVNQEFQVIGESYKAYITLLNGHVGNASVAIGPSATRVICGNTFAMAYSELGEKYRHHAGVNEKVLSSQAVLNYVNGAMEKYSQSVDKLATATCSHSQFRNAVAEIYGKEESRLRHAEKLENLFRYGAGNEGKTFYDVFNAVTDYASNFSRKTDSGRFGYANFGKGARINQRAMAVLTEMAAV